jgi:pimeloyl-ACP methyl ester carboxylesterase
MINPARGFNPSGQEMAPVAVLGGLFTGSEALPFYMGTLAGHATANLPYEDRFIPPPNRGLGDKDEMFAELEEKLLSVYDRLEQPFVLAGHSLGGLLASKFALKHPEATAAVVCFAGAQEGVLEETFCVLALRFGIEKITRRKSQYDHILFGSDHMLEHRQAVSDGWSDDVGVHLISPAHDVLFPLPHGLRMPLPKTNPANTYVVGRSTEDIMHIEGMPEQTIGIPSLLKPDHILLPWHPSALAKLREVRVEAALASGNAPLGNVAVELAMAA